jgi:mono/diheme cytochrome c family protein
MLRKLISIAVVGVGISLVIHFSPVGQTAAQKADKNVRGRQLYAQYCASCHGVDGRGNGPAAAALKTAPPDLTMIARREGKFPALRVQRIISGDDMVPGHGSREMPVWGEYFRAKNPDRIVTVGHLYALTKYVEAIQAK